MEPIFEADFEPVSYGFRRRRRAQGATAEIHFYGTGIPLPTGIGCCPRGAWTEASWEVGTSIVPEVLAMGS